jgi:F420H(2)-dependent quinone reductase
MKILLKVVGVIVACAILALVVLSITGLDPNQRRAGLWLKGDVTSFPVDWAFADKYQTVMVETHPWYLIPHTVNIFFVTDQGNLFLHADYPPGGKFPSGKSWTASVARDPNVRIKFGNQVFDCKAVAVTDQAESDALFEITRKKYPRSPYSNYRRRPDVYYFHVLPR